MNTQQTTRKQQIIISNSNSNSNRSDIFISTIRMSYDAANNNKQGDTSSISWCCLVRRRPKIWQMNWAFIIVSIGAHHCWWMQRSSWKNAFDFHRRMTPEKDRDWHEKKYKIISVHTYSKANIQLRWKKYKWYLKRNSEQHTHTHTHRQDFIFTLNE
jgi:hypothetical protein